jgi:hypothetical protein
MGASLGCRGKRTVVGSDGEERSGSEYEASEGSEASGSEYRSGTSICGRECVSLPRWPCGCCDLAR